MNHWDLLLFLVLGVLVTAVLDWRIGKRFALHERVEQAAVARLTVAADAAAHLASEVGDDLRAHRVDANNVVEAVHALAEQSHQHDRRLHTLEERLLRVGLLPTGRRHEEPAP